MRLKTRMDVDASLMPFSQHLLVEYLYQLLLKTPNVYTNGTYSFWTDDLKKTLKMVDLVLSCLKHDMSLKCCSEHKSDKHCACTCNCDRQAALGTVHMWKKDIDITWNMLQINATFMTEDRLRREVYEHFRNVTAVIRTITSKDNEAHHDVVFDADVDMIT